MKFQSFTVIVCFTLLVLLSSPTIININNSRSTLVNAVTFDRTFDISSRIPPLNSYLAQVPSIAYRANIRALCTETKCSFSIFDREQYQLYVSSEGKEGVPIVFKTAMTANTEVEVRIDADDQKRSFKTRYHGPLYVVIRNLGLESTDSRGTVHYVALLPGRMIAMGAVVLVICFLSCITLCIGFPILYMNFEQRRRLKRHQELQRGLANQPLHHKHHHHHRRTGPASSAATDHDDDDERVYIRVPSPHTTLGESSKVGGEGYGSITTTTTTTVPNIGSSSNSGINNNQNSNEYSFTVTEDSNYINYHRQLE